MTSRYHQTHTQNGFTLIEMIVVIALMAISIGVSSDIILTLIRSYTKTQVSTELEQNANFVTLKLEKELKSASSITGTPGTDIVFTDKNGTSITYALVGSLLRRTAGGVTDDVTNSDALGGVIVECTNAACGGSCFTQLNADPNTVKINLTFKRKANPNDQDTVANVCTTVVMRGSY